MSFVSVSLLPKLITSSQRKLWILLSFKVKDQSSREVVENSFRTRPDKINADVVVFGHTHVTDTYHLPSGWTFKGLRRFLKLFYPKKQSEEGREKRFVNTGCWVSPENDTDLSVPRNTFAYIDNTGIYLFKWEGKNKDPICIDCFSI